jgi:hypothetical protein
MGDGGVDKGQEFSLCPGGVVQDLLRDVVEAEHHSLLLIKALDAAFLELDELELGYKLLFNALHAR